MFKKLCASALLLTLGGCATLFSGTTQTINVKVLDSFTQLELDNTACMATDATGGSYPVRGNPGVVTVAKGHGSLSISCQKEGYKQMNTLVGNSFNPVTLVNVLWFPGFVVDLATGAYKRYPSHYVVTMEKITPATAALPK